MKFEDHQPKTLEEAAAILLSQLNEEGRDYIKANGMAGAHHGFGTGLRNGWGLWHDSELAQHFKTVYGLGHADDMSGMIFEYVEAAVQSKAFSPKDKAQFYKDYWRKQGIDPLTLKRTNIGTLTQ